MSDKDSGAVAVAEPDARAPDGTVYERVTFDVPGGGVEALVEYACMSDAIRVEEVAPARGTVADTTEARLTAALATAQAAFPPISKNKTARVEKNGQLQYTYTYADLGDVLAAVRPVLASNGLALTQRTHHKDDGTVLLTTFLRHVGGGVETSEVELGQSPSNPQAFGGALTYLRRYEMVTILGIAAEEDTDAQHVEPRRERDDRARLPGWAEAAVNGQRNRAGKALASIIGTREARAFISGADANFGYLPRGLAAFTEALSSRIVELYGKDAIAVRVNELNAVTAQAEAERPAPDEAVRQAVSGEPDVPAPEEPEPSPEELAAQPRTDLPAASVKPDDERAREVCICPGGYEAAEADPDVRDNGCPVETHGVPF